MVFVPRCAEIAGWRALAHIRVVIHVREANFPRLHAASETGSMAVKRYNGGDTKGALAWLGEVGGASEEVPDLLRQLEIA